jgi:hypothetical protein
MILAAEPVYFPPPNPVYEYPKRREFYSSYLFLLENGRVWEAHKILMLLLKICEPDEAERLVRTFRDLLSHYEVDEISAIIRVAITNAYCESVLGHAAMTANIKKHLIELQDEAGAELAALFSHPIRSRHSKERSRNLSLLESQWPKFIQKKLPTQPKPTLPSEVQTSSSLISRQWRPYASEPGRQTRVQFRPTVPAEEPPLAHKCFFPAYGMTADLMLAWLEMRFPNPRVPFGLHVCCVLP